MDSPVPDLRSSSLGSRRGRRFTRLLKKRPFLELVMAALFVLVAGAWHTLGPATPDAVPSLVASAATAIFMMICYAIRTRWRRESVALKTALMNGEIKHGGELYRAVVNTAADAIILADQRGMVLAFNRAAERIFGYREIEVVGQNVQLLIQEDQWAAHQGNLTCPAGAKPPRIIGIDNVVDGRRKDGTIFPLHLSMAEWTNGPDEIGVTAILHDITELVDAQQALVESERQIRQIVDCATDYAIYQLDLDNRIVKWNVGTERILGYAASELQGFDISRLFPKDLGPSEQGAIVPIDLERHETDGWMVRNDGTRFWASGVVRPILDSAGSAIGKAVVLRDVTQQRAGAETLQLARDTAVSAMRRESELRGEIEASNIELTAANQGLQQFTSIVAHDLRAPLKRIDAFIDALREDYNDRLDEEGKEIMTRVSRGAARMELMLDSLLDYSRYNAKAIAGKSADLAHVINGVFESFDLNGIESKITISTEGVPRIKGDPLLLAHVFQNLVSNSIKFRRPDALVIDIEAEQSGDVVHIRMTDNGIGIEPQFADQVFDMFYRLHDEDEYDGTGIGLTVCRKIISDHGGRIWIDKDYSGGTRINMTLLPAAAERRPDLDVMLLYQSEQRGMRRTAADMETDGTAVPRRANAARGHHARFNRGAH